MVRRSARAEVLTGLNALTHVGVAVNLSDAQLLDRFLVRGGEGAEAAFEVLVARHGPMVLNVCSNVLRDSNDAQDAFQATFLVLASRAGSIRQSDALAGWLLGVARRVAVRSRMDLARRRANEGRAAEMKADLKHDRAESWPELHEEIDRLPQRYREPVVLCYLEGLSTDAAALRLGCPKGTVLSRLSRARERLQGRLTRRGLAPSLGPLFAGIAPESVPPGSANCDGSGLIEFRQTTGDRHRPIVSRGCRPCQGSDFRHDDLQAEGPGRSGPGLRPHTGRPTGRRGASKCHPRGESGPGGRPEPTRPRNRPSVRRESLRSARFR